MKFVLATQNPKKLKEMSAILGELGVEVVSEADLGVKIEVEETGETFAENSLLKAKAVMEATKLPAIADDSGLCVDALNGGPGVYSARFGGEGLDDTGRYRLLLQMLHGQADRRAHFHTTITCAFPNGDVLQDDGEVEGTIAFAPMGENGFGYDPVFFVPDKRKTFAQLSAEEKAEISHRGKALRAFKETLRNYLALIKCRVLENSMLTAREACDELSALTRSEQVQVIGTKFVLYRPSHKKDKKDKIVLPKAAKKTV